MVICGIVDVVGDDNMMEVVDEDMIERYFKWSVVFELSLVFELESELLDRN